MSVKYFRFILTIFITLQVVVAFAHDIEVSSEVGSDRMVFYYNFNADGKTLSVTYCGDTPTPSYSISYPGQCIVIPDTVEYNGKKYVVTSIGDDPAPPSTRKVTVPGAA